MPPNAMAGYAKFRTQGEARADGADIVVMDAKGQVLPSEIVLHDPRLYTVVKFQFFALDREVFVYFGGGKTHPAPRRTTIQAGLFLETRRYASGLADNLKQMLELWKKAPFTFGGDFREVIFDGFNPFGPSEHFLSKYDGWIYVASDIEYSFCTASDDGSFVLIDDELICQWPGAHSAHGGARGEHNGKRQFSKGLHRVTYYHVQSVTDTATVLGLKKPGEKYHTLAPKELFVRINEAKLRDHEKRDQPFAGEIGYKPKMCMTLAAHKFLVYEFGSMLNSGGDAVVSYNWDFGSGVQSTERMPVILFLHEGDYPVKLTCRTRGGRRHVLEQNVRLYSFAQHDKTGDKILLTELASSLVNYPLSYFSDRDLVAATDLLLDCKQLDGAVKTMRLRILRLKNKRTIDYVKLMDGIARVAAEDRQKYDEAREVYDEALKAIPAKNPLRLTLLLNNGRLLVERLGKAEEALPQFKEALEYAAKADAATRREVAVALGDCFRELGRIGPAREAYRQAETVNRSALHPGFKKSSYSLTIEAYLADRNYKDAKTLMAEWEREFPTEKIEGHLPLLKGEILFQDKRYKEAFRELELARKLSASGPYAKRILVRLGDMYLQVKSFTRALEVYNEALLKFEDEELTKELEPKVEECERVLKQKGGAP